MQLLRKLGGRAAEGQVLITSTPTVARFLEEWYALNWDSWRPSTRRGYKSAIDLYLVKAFGPLRLEQLSPIRIQRWLTEHKTEHGARRRITLAHAVLRSALSEAAAAAGVVQRRRPREGAEAEDTRHRVAQHGPSRGVSEGSPANHRLGALFSVALACGLRLGEATGLRWEDVDLDSGKVQIRQQLQRVGKMLVLQQLETEKSQRTLVLPDVCVKALKEHRKRQLEERMKAGKEWRDTGLVFTTYATRGEKSTRGGGRHPGTYCEQWPHPKGSERAR